MSLQTIMKGVSNALTLDDNEQPQVCKVFSFESSSD